MKILVSIIILTLTARLIEGTDSECKQKIAT